MMTSYEKVEKAMQCIPLSDKTEIPVFPHILTWAGTVANVPQSQIITECDAWLKAMEKTFDVIGNPDLSMPQHPKTIIFSMSLPTRRPGFELPEGELYQFIEKPQFESDEYEKMLQMGWANWYAMYMMRIQNPPMTNPEEYAAFWQQTNIDGGKIACFLAQRGIAPIFNIADFPIFDLLSMMRSMEPFIFDLYDDPGTIMDVLNTYQPMEDQRNIQILKSFGGTRIGRYAMRSSATFLSPDMFEEYVWPVLKKSILTFWEAGIRCVLHCDAEWLPFLEHFLELPKTSVSFEFDGVTDIVQAYDIIGGWHSLRGDVPATMLAYGTPDEVSQYCAKLIDKIGTKGGFILGSGCEVPLNAKAECVKAMMDAVK
ncbi:MAG: uroporphyrinogen decarboxylase family protein [Eubacterium sp.]